MPFRSHHGLAHQARYPEFFPPRRMAAAVDPSMSA